MKTLVCILVSALLCGSVLARDFTFTFLLPPGKAECFHDTINTGALLEIEYQVSNHNFNYILY